jgi:DNA-dependent RNA polymerase auxiliary subunit epsilon
VYVKDLNVRTKLDGVSSWVEEEAPESFNADFIESLKGALAEYEELTSRQEEALDNIITRFKIDPSYFKE